MPIYLIFWVMLYLGYQDGKFSAHEALGLILVWCLPLLVAAVGRPSPWYFAISSVSLTLYGIWVVLGPDAKAPHGA